MAFAGCRLARQDHLSALCAVGRASWSLSDYYDREDGRGELTSRSSALISSNAVALEPRLSLSGDAGVPSSSTGSLLMEAAEMVSSGLDSFMGETGPPDMSAISHRRGRRERCELCRVKGMLRWRASELHCIAVPSSKTQWARRGKCKRGLWTEWTYCQMQDASSELRG